MKVAVLGNPVTNISPGKFLVKFVRILRSFSENLFILNDGVPNQQVKGISVISVTKFLKVLDQKKNILSSIAKFFIAQFGFCYAIVRYLKEVKVIFIFPIVLSSLPVILCRIMGKKTILYEAQDIWSEETHTGTINKIRFHFMLQARSIVLKSIDHMIVEGEHSISTNRIEEFSSKISILQQFVDTDQYAVQIPFQKRTTVTFVGYLDYRKGALDFAKAILLIESIRKDISFVIVGNGPLFNEISMLLEKQIISNRVKLLSNITESEYMQILNETKLLVLPSKAEGMPNVILESIASGALVLTTPVGAIPDLIDDNITGFLMKDPTPESIAENIKRVLDFEDNESISQRALLKVITDYSFSSAVSRYRKFFNDFLLTTQFQSQNNYFQLN